jgi:hypothetical protein
VQAERLTCQSDARSSSILCEVSVRPHSELQSSWGKSRRRHRHRSRIAAVRRAMSNSCLHVYAPDYYETWHGNQNLNPHFQSGYRAAFRGRGRASRRRASRQDFDGLRRVEQRAWSRNQQWPGWPHTSLVQEVHYAFRSNSPLAPSLSCPKLEVSRLLAPALCPGFLREC